MLFKLTVDLPVCDLFSPSEAEKNQPMWILKSCTNACITLKTPDKRSLNKLKKKTNPDDRFKRMFIKNIKENLLVFDCLFELFQTSKPCCSSLPLIYQCAGSVFPPTSIWLVGFKRESKKRQCNKCGGQGKQKRQLPRIPTMIVLNRLCEAWLKGPFPCVEFNWFEFNFFLSKNIQTLLHKFRNHSSRPQTCWRKTCSFQKKCETKCSFKKRWFVVEKQQIRCCKNITMHIQENVHIQNHSKFICVQHMSFIDDEKASIHARHHQITLHFACKVQKARKTYCSQMLLHHSASFPEFCSKNMSPTPKRRPLGHVVAERSTSSP